MNWTRPGAMPEKWEDVLVVTSAEQMHVAYWDEGSGGWFDSTSKQSLQVVFWQPLPEWPDGVRR